MMSVWKWSEFFNMFNEQVVISMWYFVFSREHSELCVSTVPSGVDQATLVYR